ncbi:hypothetical protein OG905_03755 [Streptomyces sp. NBC_00322]|uniref:hypothetical protein n=1 Tax=Streptomyces sp. NBC_00322 TaxID=2975712 RepID=UPI002E29C30A|nr:hypothetical protein [Streptomyces sp. NBC_00322]
MPMSLRETLQLTVAALMHATGDSQSELAGALGLTQTQVSRRQAGRTAWTLDDWQEVPLPPAEERRTLR